MLFLHVANTLTIDKGAAVAEGGRVVVLQPEGRQFDPQSSQKNLHAEVSLSNPELCLIEQQSAANRCTVWMCVWLGECKTVL